MQMYILSKKLEINVEFILKNFIDKRVFNNFSMDCVVL